MKLSKESSRHRLAQEADNSPRIDQIQNVINQWIDTLGAAKAKTLTALFLKNAKQQISLLEKARAVGDREALGQTAHQLKGGCAQIGAFHMSDLCTELEYLVESGTLAEVPPIVARLKQGLRRAGETISSRFP